MTETLHTWVLLQRLCSNVRRPPASLKRLQDRLLRAVIMHASGNIPFYHRVWDEASFDARSVRGIRDLERIPIITGRMVREAAQRGNHWREAWTRRDVRISTRAAGRVPLPGLALTMRHVQTYARAAIHRACPGR